MRFAFVAVLVILAFSAADADLKTTIKNALNKYAGKIIGKILSFVKGKSGKETVAYEGIKFDVVYNIEKCKILGVGKKRFISQLKAKCKATFTAWGCTGSATKSSQSAAIRAAIDDLKRKISAIWGR